MRKQNKDTKKLLFEMMEKVNPDFKKKTLNEEVLNEGWKENIVAGLMMLGGVMGTQAQRANTPPISIKADTDKTITIPNPFGDDYIRDRTQATQDIERVKQLLDRGWELDSVVLDTIWTTIQRIPEIKPDTFYIKSGYIDNSMDYFDAGLFNLSNDYMQLLSDTLEAYKGQAFLNIWITASTDKQGLRPETSQRLINAGYEGTNAGLAQARAEAIKNYLLNDLNVNADSIHLDLRPEQGTGTDDEFTSGEFRFIDVEFNFVVIPDIEPMGKTTPDQEYDIEKTYHMSRQEVRKSEINIPIPSISVSINLFGNRNRDGVRCNNMRPSRRRRRR